MRDEHRHTVRTLEKRAIDTLVDQLFSQIGNNPRMVGPEGSFSPLDDKYVGVLRLLLQQFIPNIPDSVLQSVREDLIVVTQHVLENPSQIVSVGQSRLRVGKQYHHNINEIKSKYAELLKLEVTPSPYNDTDIDFSEASIIFQDTFFAARSIKGWCRLSLYFARLCASMDQLSAKAGLKGESVFHSDRETHLLFTGFVSSNGQEMELITPS